MHKGHVILLKWKTNPSPSSGDTVNTPTGGKTSTNEDEETDRHTHTHTHTQTHTHTHTHTQKPLSSSHRATSQSLVLLISRLKAKGRGRSYLGKKGSTYPHFWLRQGHQAGHVLLGPTVTAEKSGSQSTSGSTLASHVSDSGDSNHTYFPILPDVP
jgi:hypothetical protein